MVNIRLFLFFFRKENIFNILLFLSSASLLFVGDIFFLFFLMRLFGTFISYFFFFFITALGQLGLFYYLSHLIDSLSHFKETGENYRNIYLAYAGALPSVLYLIYPGIISTLIGFILLFPPIGRPLGKYLSSYLEIDWDEINEYLFLLF